MRVSQWGNSLAVRIPSAVVDRLGIRPGDRIQFQVLDGGKLVASHVQVQREVDGHPFLKAKATNDEKAPS